MQQTSLGRLARCLMAVFVVVCSFALLACPGDDDDVVVRNVSATVPANPNTIAIVQGQPITIPNGTVFNIGAQPLTLTFNNATTATIARAGATSSNATVTFASCTFTVTGPANGVIQPVPQTFSFPTCNFLVTANGVEVDGDEVVGQVILILINAAGIRVDSLPLAVEVRINSDGILFVNDIDTGINTNVTGTTGTTGG